MKLGEERVKKTNRVSSKIFDKLDLDVEDLLNSKKRKTVGFTEEFFNSDFAKILGASIGTYLSMRMLTVVYDNTMDKFDRRVKRNEREADFEYVD